MNDQQRAAMQMALETVELLKAFLPYLNPNTVQSPYHLAEKTITALREALAQPQGEPVAWYYKQTHVYLQNAGDVVYIERVVDKPQSWDEHPLYFAPPSVEAAIEATKEKAAKVCEECFAEYANNRGLMLVADKCAAAIRSMK